MHSPAKWLKITLTVLLCFYQSLPAWSQTTTQPTPKPLQIGIYCDGATPEEQQVSTSLSAKIVSTLENAMVKSKIIELTKEQYSKITSGESNQMLDYLLKVRILSYDITNQTKTTPMKAKYKTGTRTVTDKNPEHLAAQQRQAMNEFARKQINDNMEKGLLKDGMNLLSNMLSNVNNSVSETKDREVDVIETYSYFEVNVIKSAMIEFKIDLREVKTDTAMLSSPILEETVSHSDKMVMGNADAGVEEDPLELPSNTQFAKQVSTRLAEVVQEKGTSVLQKMEAERFPVALVVESTPSGAMVYLDGKEVGPTPLQIPTVFLGKHEVSVKMAKHMPFSKGVFIEGNEGHVALTAQLQRITTGTMHVSAYLDKTMVATVDNDFLRALNSHMEKGLPVVVQRLDGSPAQSLKTPVKLTLAEGQYRVKAMLNPMYEVFDQTIQIEGASERLIDIPVKATPQLLQSQEQMKAEIAKKAADGQAAHEGCNSAGWVWTAFNWLGWIGTATLGTVNFAIASTPPRYVYMYDRSPKLFEEDEKQKGFFISLNLIVGIGTLISTIAAGPVLGNCHTEAHKLTLESTHLQQQVAVLADPFHGTNALGSQPSPTLISISASPSDTPSEFDKKYEALMAQLSSNKPASTNLINANGVLTVVGRGAAPAEATTDEQKKMLAKQAAIADGYRQLARSISALKVDATTTLKDLMTQNDTIKSKLSVLADLIKGASIGYARTMPDGSVEVDMGIEDALKHIGAVLGVTIPFELNVKG